EPEEKILEEKNVTGRAAFVRLFDETVASMRFPFAHGGRDESLSLQQINAFLYHAHLLTYLMNTLVLDHRSDCNLRHFDSPMGPRHLANEISDRVVDALLTAAERYHGTVQRYYRLKGRLLGLDQLADYDRYAPLFADMPACDWPTAHSIVQE